MKRSNCWRIALGLFLAACFFIGMPRASGQVSIGPGINQVSNSGFESGLTGWTVSSSTDCQVVQDQYRSGQKSLRIIKTVNNAFRYINYILPCVPGARYRFSAWVKTTGLSATWESFWGYARCYDSANNQIGKWEAMTVVKPSAWIRISGESAIIPRNAARVDVTFYMPYSCTGTVWVDDVFVEAIDDVISTAALRYPNYRHTILSGQPKKLTVGVQITDSVRHPLSNLTLSAVVLNSSGKAIAHAEDTCQPGKIWENIGFNLSDAAAGDYHVVVKAIDKTGNVEVSARTLDFTIASATATPPKVFIDDNNRYVVDGKPFFPLGFYIHVPNSDLLDLMAAGKYNCAISYNMPGTETQVRAYFAAAASRGIKLMFPLVKFYDGVGNTYPADWGSYSGNLGITQGYISTFKNESALLAWYLSEDLNEAAVPQIGQKYDLVRSLDPDHPASVAYGKGDCALYLAQCSDTVGVYAYPILDAGAGTPDLTKFGTEMTNAWNATLGCRSVWMVPECSSQTDFSATSRAPTYNEMMCEAFQGLVGGARGLIFYYLFNAVTYDGAAQTDIIKRVGAELSSIGQIALGLDADPPKRVLSQDSRVKVCTRAVGSDLYVLAVNPTTAGVSASFKIGPAASASKAEALSGGTVSRTIPVANGAFQETIETLGTRVYRLVP